MSRLTHHHSFRDKKPSQGSRNVRFIAKLSFLAIFIFVGIFLVKGVQFLSHIQTPKFFPGTKVSPTPPEKYTYTILLMGYGGSTHDGTYLTDTMMVLHVDLKKKKATLISIPRDTWVKFPTKSGDDFHSKINSIYQIELFPNEFPDVKVDSFKDKVPGNGTKALVAQVVGFPIDNYLAVDFDGFQKAIDILGGIDVKIEKGFTDPEYPVDGKERDLCGKQESDLPELEKIATESPQTAFPCRYETLVFTTGIMHMDGGTALKFVRSRHSLEDGGDFNRASRQQLFLQAVKDKVLQLNFVTKVIPLMDELQNHIRTDVATNEMTKFLPEATRIEEYKLSMLVLSDSNFLMNDVSDNGQFILVSKEGEDKWQSVHTGIHNFIEGITPSPSPLPSLSPASRK